MIAQTWTLSRLSREWVGPITVTADGTPVADWLYAIVPSSAQPADSADIDGVPIVLDDTLGVLVGPESDNPLGPGRYRIWIRYTAGQEAPVLECVGVLVIT